MKELDPKVYRVDTFQTAECGPDAPANAAVTITRLSDGLTATVSWGPKRRIKTELKARQAALAQIAEQDIERYGT